MPRSTFVFTIAAIAGLWLAIAAATTDRDAALRGAEYIATTQEDDGGFGGFGPGQTFDAVYALRSVGIDPTTVETGGNSPADYLRANLDEVSASPGLAAKGALAAVAMDLDPRDVDGIDLLGAVEGFYDDATGAYAGDAFEHSLAVLGLVCTGGDVSTGALDFIREAQLEDGGWGFEDAGDPDTTAIVLQAYLAGGGESGDETAGSALQFFQETQAADAGWGFDPAESNANSTAYVIQALTAAGEDPTSDTYTVDGVTPLERILSLQQEDGSFPGFDPAFATNQTVPALAGRTFCDAPATALEDIELEAPESPGTGTGMAPGGQSMPLPAIGLALMLAGAAGFALTLRRAR